MTQYPAIDKIIKRLNNRNGTTTTEEKLTATADVAVHHFGCDAVRPTLRRMIFAEEIQNAAFRIADFTHRNAVDELNKPCVCVCVCQSIDKEERKKNILSEMRDGQRKETLPL